MRGSRQERRYRGHAAFLRLIAGLAACTLAGCVAADFDRERITVFDPPVHERVQARLVERIGGPASEYKLTDDEKLLRDFAYAIVKPPYERERWYDVLAHHGLKVIQINDGAYDHAAYWNRMDATIRESEQSAYAKVVTDTRSDTVRIEPFFATAWKVTDMDRKRVMSLGHVSGLSTAEYNNAVARTQENVAIVRWVCHCLHERAAGYRFAIERLVISTPSPSAAEAERSLNYLQMRIARYCRIASAQRPDPILTADRELRFPRTKPVEK
jgi:hypothetical protein